MLTDRPHRAVARRIARIGASVIVFATCLAPTAGTDAWAAELSTELERQLAGRAWQKDQVRRQIRDFYVNRAYRPLWVSEGRLGQRTDALIDVLSAAGDEGLQPGRYLRIIGDTSKPGATTELRLSRAILRYVSDRHSGAVRPRVRYLGVERPMISGGPTAILDRLANAKDLTKALTRFAPSHPGYQRLQGALTRYQTIAKAGGWVPIAARRTKSKGLSDTQVAQLRARLVLTGDLAKTPKAGVGIGDALQAALRRFQDRHGLPQTGTPTSATLRALNVPVRRRIATIEVNLERLRWISAAVVRRSVMVNVAAFDLNVIERGVSRLETRVIVGKCYQRTPQFVTMMTGVQFNPYWNVPNSITRNEILPRLKRDPGYLRRQRMRVVVDGRAVDPATVDWSKMRGRSVKIRQQPGAHNALGRIRFLMPNPFNVYLHDTPSKKLFERRRRAFSHGCIRVQNPGSVAAYLLRGAADWDAAAVKRAMTRSTQRIVKFPAPLPVYVGYFTAWASTDGRVHFRDDLYRRDPSLSRALHRTR